MTINTSSFEYLILRHKEELRLFLGANQEETPLVTPCEQEVETFEAGQIKCHQQLTDVLLAEPFAKVDSSHKIYATAHKAEALLFRCLQKVSKRQRVRG
jgi:hypothetical protein